MSGDAVEQWLDNVIFALIERLDAGGNLGQQRLAGDFLDRRPANVNWRLFRDFRQQGFISDPPHKVYAVAPAIPDEAGQHGFAGELCEGGAADLGGDRVCVPHKLLQHRLIAEPCHNRFTYFAVPGFDGDHCQFGLTGERAGGDFLIIEVLIFQRGLCQRGLPVEPGDCGGADFGGGVAERGPFKRALVRQLADGGFADLRVFGLQRDMAERCLVRGVFHRSHVRFAAAEQRRQDEPGREAGHGSQVLYGVSAGFSPRRGRLRSRAKRMRTI